MELHETVLQAPDGIEKKIGQVHWPLVTSPAFLEDLRFHPSHGYQGDAESNKELTWQPERQALRRGVLRLERCKAFPEEEPQDALIGA